ncbi:unnamed protein product [Rotaria magnacalcarata]|uniref:GxGYxYP putative glycoside hydrolase C-terminal domain-containing protein n=1 Tax=Rotaria magnacalcarata TaxID=392030 RepID=A0A816GGB2_9BILA|nr:unnamed protein product [Rotaria magnacalcarata]CAF1673314.1 unnamed protein product [Rotaria magnacalcarata]CAF2062184.1 unnamed protein product [Rotaria magnacalcarata]CAF4049246.1 unnamed protein product [Rotaria magnacalcarata]CAF4069008.1 unnamed protein product [Rotaria magnacalcarata]
MMISSRYAILTIFTILITSNKATTTNIVLYDLRPSTTFSLDDIYEYAHLLGALSGLMNRDIPRLFTIYNDSDLRWLFYMASINWPQDANYMEAASLVDLIKFFSDTIQGVALYDPIVPATSNLASTASGVYNLIPICYRPVPNSLYTQLVVEGPQLPIKINFVDMFTGNITGSSKADAYLWAAEHFLDSKLADSTYLGYYIDKWWSQSAQASQAVFENLAVNHDWIIKNRGFLFDLSPWDDEAPNDDPQQPIGTDYNTLITLLKKSYQQHNGTKFSTVSGFVPWLFKYVNEKHGGVPSEWRMTHIMSAFNVVIDADACCVDSFANAAFFSHYASNQSEKRFIQNVLPSREELIQKEFLNEQNIVSRKTYSLYYAGDYDSAAWLANKFKNLWDDPKRGSVPVAWAVNPNLYDRFPLLHPYLYQTRTANDFFVSGDSGSGYLNPTQLFEPRKFSSLPRADNLWIERNQFFYNKFNIKHTGFVINGDSGMLTNDSDTMYTKFSPLGFTRQQGYTTLGETALIPGTRVPSFTETDLSGKDEVQQVLSYYKPNDVRFVVFRGVLRSASSYADIAEKVQQIQPNITFVDPYTFALLARIHLSGNPAYNDDLVSYVDDNLPNLISTGEYVTVNFSIRNEGWNTLNELDLKLTFACDIEYVFRWNIEIKHGNIGTSCYQFQVKCDQPGEYKVVYQLFRGNTSFEEFGNVPWISSVRLV